LIATKWVAAVRLLGELRATEAIDALVENLDQSGQNAVTLSINFRPVRGAVIKIGEPAIPRLISALSNPKPSIRYEAAWALNEIGGSEAMKALKSAAASESDEYVQRAFKSIFAQPPAPPEVTREASAAACNRGQIVAASFYVSGPDSVPVMLQTACARAPVEITRMKVKADGSFYIYFRNLDASRKVVGVAYLVTTLDERGKVEGDMEFIAGLLEKPTEPGAEMNESHFRAMGSPKSIASKASLVRFSSIRFDDGSEWQLKADCTLSGKMASIRCRETKE
jgi:hypothetical protein